MKEQTQQIPPSRKDRRRQMRAAGVLRAISKLSFFHPVKQQIREENQKNGRRIHQMHQDRNDAKAATFFENKLNASKSTWFGMGYNKEEIDMLEEAWSLTIIKDKESYRTDKKKAKELRKQVAASLAARNK